MDLCKLLLWVLVRPEKTELIALVPDKEHSIWELASAVAREFGIKEVRMDSTKADG